MVWKLRFFSVAISLVVFPKAISFRILLSAGVSKSSLMAGWVGEALLPESNKLLMWLQMKRSFLEEHCSAVRISSLELSFMTTPNAILLNSICRKKGMLNSSENSSQSASLKRSCNTINSSAPEKSNKV